MQKPPASPPRTTEAAANSIAEVKAWWDDAQSFYGSRHTRIGKEIAFALDGQHYQDDNDSDPQRIKPVDPALFNQQRHKGAQILKASSHYEVRPVDDQADPQTAATVRALLHQVFDDPECELPDALEDVVDGALAAGIWGLQVGYDPDCQALTFDGIDPRKSYWTPGFKLPTRRCPWLILEKSLLPAAIERMASRGWKHTKDCPTDAVAMSAVVGSSQSPIVNSSPGGMSSNEQRYTTVLFCYEQNVKDMAKVPSFKRLVPGDQYMNCPSCPFQGLPQSFLDQPLPPKYGDPCPNCGATTVHQYAEPIDKEMLAYLNGQRLRIIAPHAGREFYNDRWEYENKSFTCVFFSPYNHPVNALPNSDTYHYRSLACVSDAMLRLGYEQMRKAHGIILAPQDSLYDAYGEPFAFSEHRDIAYYDTEFLTPGAIQWFQAPGLNTAWTAYFQTIQGVFAANKGTSDIGLGPAQSKDIAVGTIDTIVETGEIPVDRHIARFQRFLSKVRTRAYEILRSVETNERALRVLGPDGVDAVRNIRAAGLPGVDVIVTAEPNIAKDALDKIPALMQVASAPPQVRMFLARALNLDPHLVDMLNAIPAPMPDAPTPNGNSSGGANRVAGYMNQATNGATQP